jgi:chitinase
MHALSSIPIALLALLSASCIPAVHAGYQCALIPPKRYTKSSTGGTPDHGGGGTAPPAGPAGNTTSPGPSGNGTAAAECVTQKVSAAWYTGWHAAQFPPSAVAWDKYSLVTYSFATTTGQDDPLSVSDADAQILPEFVRTAHANVRARACAACACVRAGADARIGQNCKASLSLGGWGGSEYFSSSVATQSNRTDLVNAILGLVSKYDLDGIDFECVHAPPCPSSTLF